MRIFKQKENSMCTNGKIHRFESRYNYGPSTLSRRNNITAADTDEIFEIIEASRSKTYIYDICVKCGKIIKKKR